MTKTNTVVFDQVYKLLTVIRAELRDSYDLGKLNVVETSHFCLDNDGQVTFGDEANASDVACTVSWANNNAELRTLSRDVMRQLLNSDD